MKTKLPKGMMDTPKEQQSVVHRYAPEVFTCPRGHSLPRRMPWGRCSPELCIGESPETSKGAAAPQDPGVRETDIMPIGTEQMALAEVPSDTLQAAAMQARADEAHAMARSIARRAARDAAMPSPVTPAAPKTTDPRVWVEERLNQLAPLALHELELAMRYGGLQQRISAAGEILDRSGFTRKPQGSMDYRGPVVVVNAGMSVPWDAQKAPKTVDIQRVDDASTQRKDKG